ncbi:MAG: hypothetical protein IT463_07500 [Planctomycetes bacterium]|nr:hypothetical protein [Planctomycetota bacterium]
MSDLSRGRARQPQSPPHKKHERLPRRGNRRRGPERPAHARTAHELDPRRAAFETLRRLKPGELLEPAAQRTLTHMGHDEGAAHRLLPMLEDATRLALLLDHLVAHVASRPPAELDADVRAALHLFLAWLLLGDSKAAYAHGNAAVDLLSATHKGRGFVNACVRRLAEFVRVEPWPAEDFAAMAARHEAPPLWANAARLGQGKRLCAERAIFPDPIADLPAHLATACALPRWFVDRLLEQHGPQAAVQVAVAAVERPATWLRLNPLAKGSEHVAGDFRARGLAAEEVAMGEGRAVVQPASSHIAQHPGFERGLFYVQDFSAQLVAPMLQPREGEMLLDLCASPGGKSGHLAELTGDRAKVLACDQTEGKVARIHENVVRMGYRSVATVTADAAAVRFPERFDGVLLDAPCSNSGVLGRRVEARHRLTAETVAELAKLQKTLLGHAADHLVKPGGRLVYSVCSLLMEEGVDVVHAFLAGAREDAGWEMEAETLTLPVPGRHDGGYCCRLRAPK